MCGKRWINSAVTTWKFMVTNNILEALFVKLVRVNIPYPCGHRFLHVALPVLSSLYCYIGFCKICKCNLRNKSWILCHDHNSTKSQFQCQNIPCSTVNCWAGRLLQRIQGTRKLYNASVINDFRGLVKVKQSGEGWIQKRQVMLVCFHYSH